jgi:hypothetical protein
MGTLATYFRRSDIAALGRAQTAGRAETDQWDLRALPNEDVYFYSKRIDNSRVVRQVDRKAHGECWNVIGALALAAALLTSVCAPGVGRLIAGYQIQALEGEYLRLLNERRVLEVEEAALRSPARLEELARERNLAPPAPDQIIHLDPQNDGSLALNK